MLKDLALKFANGILLGALFLVLVFLTGFIIKLTYTFFLSGWNFI